MKPVYLDGTLHWLREDGSIVAFNPKTEQARLIIPIKFHRKPDTKLLLGASDNHRLTLISATEKEAISVFALENKLTHPKWILVRLIGDEAVQKSIPLYWNVEAFDGKCLLVTTMKNGTVVHGYDLRANKWEVVGSIPGWCDANRVFYQFKPSWSSTLGLLDQEEEKDGSKLKSKPDRFTIAKSEAISSVKGVMELVNLNLRI